MFINGKEIKAVLLDKDGTVFASEQFRLDLRMQYAKEKNLPLTRQMIIDCIGKSGHDYMEMMQKQIGEAYNYEEIEEMLVAYETTIEKEIGVPLREKADAFIKLMFENKISLAMVTSSFHDNAVHALQQYQLERYFSLIIGVDDVEFPKPNPQPYTQALEQLKLDPETTLVFEDSPTGVKSALAAGLNVVFIQDLVELPEELHKHVFLTIASWDEIFSHIQL